MAFSLIKTSHLIFCQGCTNLAVHMYDIFSCDNKLSMTAEETETSRSSDIKYSKGPLKLFFSNK